MASAAILIPDQKVFTTGQVAKLCCVANRTASKWIDNGMLQGYKVPGGKDRRVTRESLVAFMEENKMLHVASAAWPYARIRLKMATVAGFKGCCCSSLSFCVSGRKRSMPRSRSTSDHLSCINAPMRPANELVFYFPCQYTHLFYLYNKILKAAGLPHGRGSMFHRMRKSAASYYEAEGGNATALLGQAIRRVRSR